MFKSLSRNILFTCLVILLSTGFLFAQNKRNSRPTNDDKKPTVIKDKSKINNKLPVYFYEFSQPDFLISNVKIEHNQKGIGNISFQKKDFEDFITEPIKLSKNTLDRLNNAITKLNYLDSDEVYQSKDRDYAHLGTIRFRVKSNEKERLVEFNWTENKNAKVLAEEYRKITNQFIWVFDMNVARENQPLESPKIIRYFDSMLTRNQISDPDQLMPFLKEISSDERFPLITRNHATRILKKIEKSKQEKEEKKEEKAKKEETTN